MHRIRLAVRENRLEQLQLTEADYVREIEVTGRGWVALEGGEVVGFAVGNRDSGSIWALFVDPAHEGCGHGRRLHDAMLAWLQDQGLRRLCLTTAPGTRAEAFYRRAGWTLTGHTPSGECKFEIETPAALSPRA